MGASAGSSGGTPGSRTGPSESCNGEPGAWTYTDTSSEKTWTDTSVPGGVASVRYRVRTKLTNGVLSDWSVGQRW